MIQSGFYFRKIPVVALSFLLGRFVSSQSERLPSFPPTSHVHSRSSRCRFVRRKKRDPSRMARQKELQEAQGPPATCSQETSLRPAPGRQMLTRPAPLGPVLLPYPHRGPRH